MTSLLCKLTRLLNDVYIVNFQLFRFIRKSEILFSMIRFSNVRAPLDIIESSVMKGTVFIVFDEDISLLSVFRSPQTRSTQSQMQTYFSLSVSVCFQSVKMERCYILCNSRFVKRKPCSCCSGNLHTAPVLALRCSQFKVSAYHSSQLTEHEICRKHHRELEKRDRTCFSSFHNENTESKQRLQKYPKFI